MEVNPAFLSPCGLYCGVCGVYYATRDKNPEFTEKLMGVYQDAVPGLEKISQEDLQCEGCLSGKLSLFCRADAD
jgi:hypothetical protein